MAFCDPSSPGWRQQEYSIVNPDEGRPHFVQHNVASHDHKHPSCDARPSSPPAIHVSSIGSFETEGWFWELCTLVLGALVTGAISGILVWMNTKPYFESWVMPISINSVLAILTAATCAANLHSVSSAIGQLKWIDFKTKRRPFRLWDIYDECSRGPLGALKSLFLVAPGSLLVGALIVLGGLAVPSFTQQSVVLVSRNISSPASAAVVKFATEYNIAPSSVSEWIGNGNFELRDSRLRGAIMQGIYGIPTATSFECGGACEWPGTYNSIAFTSTCKNVTQETARTKNCSTVGQPKICNMTTPGGVRLQTKLVQTELATALILNTTSELVYAEGQPRLSLDVSSELLRLAVFRAGSGGSEWVNSLTDIVGQDVTECSISLVSREFRNFLTNGTAINRDTVSDVALGTGFMTGTEIRPDSSPDQPRRLVTYGFTKDGKALSHNITIGTIELFNLFAFFRSPAFSSHIIGGYTLEEDSGGAVSAFLTTMKDGQTDFPGAEPAVESIEKLVRGMTDAMSEYVRVGTANSQDVTGNKIEQVVFVSVKWQWLILLWVWQILAVVFLGVIIWQNKRSGHIILWKNSAAAMIMHRYDGEQMELIGSEQVDSTTLKGYSWYAADNQ